MDKEMKELLLIIGVLTFGLFCWMAGHYDKINEQTIPKDLSECP